MFNISAIVGGNHSGAAHQEIGAGLGRFRPLTFVILLSSTRSGILKFLGTEARPVDPRRCDTGAARRPARYT
jgi:hypothetical protein